MTKQKVWCLVIDQEKQAIGHPFNFNVLAEENIGELRKRVNEKMKADLDGLTANSLIVWQCKERKLLSTNDKEEIDIFLGKIDFCEEREVVGLTSGRKLKDLELGDEEVVLVQLPNAYKKRKLEEKDPLIEFYKNRNTDLEAAHNSPTPFSAAASPRLSEEQSSRPVLNGQPLGLHAEPIGLFHPVFNQFQADLNNTERFIGDAMTYDRVRYLFFAFANIYASDAERVEGIEEVMEGLLDREFTVMKKQEVPSDRVMTQSCGESKVYLVIQDVKCEFGMSDPHIQAGLTYQKYWARQESLIRRCCCPSIILSIAGPWLCVIGGVYFAEAITQPLTEYLWLGGNPYDPKRQVFAARLFAALKSAISTLADYYRTLALEPNSGVPPSISNPYPFITEYGAQKTKFTYLCRLAEKYPHKLLYKARLDDMPDTLIVIKFVERYNVVAHRHLASCGLAPNLRYSSTEDEKASLYGGRYMLVMDYVDLEPCIGPLTQPQYERVEQAIKILHSEKMVFGDLRPQNILIGNDTVMLIDFGWCGKEGKDHYPVELNSDEELWHADVGPDCVMTKDHDIYMLEKLKECIS